MHHFSPHFSFFQLFFFLIFLTTSSFSKQNDWELYHVKLYIENDILAREDSQYTGGAKLDVVYKIDNPDGLYKLLIADDAKIFFFRSFAIGSQIYTPNDLTQSKPIFNDWSYAAWTYGEVGVHKSTEKTLNSLLLKIGVVGSNAKGKEVQTAIHKWTNSTKPEGWDNQIYNELGIDLTYIYKRRYEYEDQTLWGLSIVPSFDVDFGNIVTQSSLGVFIRMGYNTVKDFGSSTMSVGGESCIPVYSKQKQSLQQKWSISFNTLLRGSVVARDIFVEGNTFRKSIVSHERNNFVVYIGGGISIRYRSFNFDFMQIYNTPKAKDIDRSKSVGTVLLTYFY
jgi:hypothetical protein